MVCQAINMLMERVQVQVHQYQRQAQADITSYNEDNLAVAEDRG